MFRLIKYINLLSLDVVLGALCSASMATWFLRVELSFYWWFCFAAAIWITYIGDHLIDSLKLKAPVDYRRKFIHNHFKKLSVFVFFLAIVAAIVSLSFLSVKIISFGIVLGGITIIYLTMVYIFGQHKKKWLQKELYVSLIYTMGVWGSALLTTKEACNFEVTFIIFAFFLLVFSAILIFSIYDYKLDEKHQFTSLIKLTGLKKVSNLAVFSLIISGLLSTSMLVSGTMETRKITTILLIMTLSLFLLNRFRQALSVNDYYRYIGEAVFFLPALVNLF